MSFLRIGVACAVRDEVGRILLSRRGDLDVWNLPTGRLDSGELLTDAAVREVREETGLACEILRPVGLYFLQGQSRLNVLYEARQTGGTLQQETAETTANRYFQPEALPSRLFGDFMVRDVLSGGTHQFVLETPPEKLREIRQKLAWRWVKNLLRGHIEPRWHQFEVNAAVIIQDESLQRVLTVPIGGDQWLPRIQMNGEKSPWNQASDLLCDQCRWDELDLKWSGVVQTPSIDRIVFVFRSVIPASWFCSELRWTYLGDPTLLTLDHNYIATAKDTGNEVWSRVHYEG